MDSRPNVIVVDDEPEIRHSINDLLRRGYHLRTFGKAEDALVALEGLKTVHAVLTDQRMPGMNGVEFLRHARSIKPDTTRMLMTGYADMKTVVEAVNEGNVFRFVPKPWDPSELELAVKQAVAQHDLIVERSRLIEELQAKNELLRESERLKDAFIEVASHELNTPVTVILGLSDLWRIVEGPNAGEQERAWVDRIHHAGKRLANTIERMFRLVKSTEIADRLDLVEAPLAPLLRRASEDLAPYLQARKLTLDVELDEELGTAEIDAVKIADVLHNLLVNAIKFTADGGLIRLRARPAEEDDAVMVEVIDEGVGIRPEETKHLFRPFFTGYDTLHHSSGDFQFGKKGMGLGLTLVKSYVEAHGGTVWAKSRFGAGSTFGFRLPRRPKKPKASVNREADRPGEPSGSSGDT